MTTGGWIFMLITWAIIISLVAFTYARTITHDEEDCDDESST